MKYLSTRGAAQALAAAKAVEIEEKLALQVAYLKVLREALGEDDIFVDELTQVGYVSRVAYPVYGPHTFITTGYQGTPRPLSYL